MKDSVLPAADGSRHPCKLRAYECGLKGYEHTRIIHHISAAKAKGEYFLDLCEAFSPSGAKERGAIFKRMTCRVSGPPQQSDAFRRTAESRGVPFARIGMVVECDGERGVIVDRNDSANFEVLFDSGKIGNCHPYWNMRYFDKDGTLVYDSSLAQETPAGVSPQANPKI